ncbi:MAG TPA: MFS transporter [Chloroflexota bacterium]|nr:MFS transporter [Chloroflexota bacterium]
MTLLAALVLCSFADEWTTYWPFGGLEPIRAELGLTYAETGIAVGSLTAGGLLGHFFRVAADFVPLKRLASLGALGVAAGMLIFGLGHSLPLLAVGGFIWGASTDAFFTGCELALVDLCPDDLPAALGRVNAYGAAGDLLGPLTLAGILAAGLSWRVVFVAGAVFMLAYAALLASQTFPPRQAEPPEPAASAVLSVLRDPRVILFGVVDALHGLLDEPMLGFLNAFLEEVRGWTPPFATALISAMVAAGLLGYLAVPSVTRRLASRKLLPAFAALAAGSIATLVFVPLPPLQVLAAIVFGFAGAVFYAVLESTYLSLRPGQAGTTGAVISAIGLAGLAFPALVGAVSDAHGLTAGMALYAAIPVLVVALVLAAGAATRARTTH